MRAVNLIPGDSRHGAVRSASLPQGPALALVGALALALVFVTVYVLTANTISERKAKVGSLQTQAAETSRLAARLTPYTEFAALAQTRAQTVREIASTRFDWHAALSDLSKVVPADTSLQSLTASVAPGASAAGAGGAAAGSLRSDIASPAFELTGCTKTQVDVAKLMSRLRLINGVTRVTLGDTQKQDSTQAGATVSSSASSTTGSGAAHGCGANTPAFDVVVFFQPLPGAGPQGATAVTSQSVSNAPTTSGGSK